MPSSSLFWYSLHIRYLGHLSHITNVICANTQCCQLKRKQWRCNAFVCYSEHKDIDADLPEFPVGAANAKNQTGLDRQKCKYYFGDNVKAKSISGKKFLLAAQLESRSTLAGMAYTICGDLLSAQRKEREEQAQAI